jgi:hypothetical protein
VPTRHPGPATPPMPAHLRHALLNRPGRRRPRPGPGHARTRIH